MDDDEPSRAPVKIHILNGRGYVWDADDALYMRKSCSLIGAMVGGVAAFKQQNLLHGLPLQLIPEEVTMMVEKGWAVLLPAVMRPEVAKASATPTNKRKWGTYADEDYDEAGGEGDSEDGYDDQEEEQEAAPAPWQDALARGTMFDVPVSLEEAEAAQTGGGGGETPEEGSGNVGGENGGAGGVKWTFPATEEQRHSYIVFRDLHRQGFVITGGSKFGADFLLYPGDPNLYHAQFCVRLMPLHGKILPAMLASACRGSFQARKHLLLASVVGDGSDWHEPGKCKVVYTTMGPVDGFG